MGALPLDADWATADRRYPPPNFRLQTGAGLNCGPVTLFRWRTLRERDVLYAGFKKSGIRMARVWGQRERASNAGSPTRRFDSSPELSAGMLVAPAGVAPVFHDAPTRR